MSIKLNAAPVAVRATAATAPAATAAPAQTKAQVAAPVDTFDAGSGSTTGSSTGTSATAREEDVNHAIRQVLDMINAISKDMISKTRA